MLPRRRSRAASRHSARIPKRSSSWSAGPRSSRLSSPGNTGAVLAASPVLLGIHDGVERASVATLFPTADDPVLVLDGGANVDCSARELVNFAVLGTVYMRDILGRANPAVGLLNVGE